jgi:hypothetical protein
MPGDINSVKYAGGILYSINYPVYYKKIMPEFHFAERENILILYL